MGCLSVCLSVCLSSTCFQPGCSSTRWQLLYADMGCLRQGDVCSSCGSPFHRSLLSFEHLPLVQFYLADGISDAEALVLLSTSPDQDSSPASGSFQACCASI
jgi:hypothetical protein